MNSLTIIVIQIVSTRLFKLEPYSSTDEAKPLSSNVGYFSICNIYFIHMIVLNYTDRLGATENRLKSLYRNSYE